MMIQSLLNMRSIGRFFFFQATVPTKQKKKVVQILYQFQTIDVEISITHVTLIQLLIQN